jgi:heterodisulfide reductase subunit B
MARTAGAECLAVACPLCETNLDLRQADARKFVDAAQMRGDKPRGSLPETPVLYVTQLLGWALGLSPEELGLSAPIVSPMALLASTGAELAVAREGAR